MSSLTINMRHCKVGLTMIHSKVQIMWWTRSRQLTRHCLKMGMWWSTSRRNVMTTREINLIKCRCSSRCNNRCSLCFIDKWITLWWCKIECILGLGCSECLRCKCRCPWWIWLIWNKWSPLKTKLSSTKCLVTKPLKILRQI